MSTASKQPTTLPIFLTDDDIRSLADVDKAIAAIRDAYRSTPDGTRTPGRIFAQAEQEWQRIMPAIPTSGNLFGSKTIAGSFSGGLTVSYLIALFDKDTAELTALLDGNHVTGLRTAATSAIGAQLIAGEEPLRVGVIGSGFEARSHLDSIGRVLDLRDVSVYSPTPENREKFATEFDTRLPASVRAVSSSQEAVEDADLVLCAARSRDESPTIAADWLKADCALVSIGSTTPAQRELPTDAIAKASTILVDTYDEVVHGSGDLLAAAAEGIPFEHKTITLAHALSQRTTISDGLRIYKSTGAGLQDIAVAALLFQDALEQNVGTRLPVSLVTVPK